MIKPSQKAQDLTPSQEENVGFNGFKKRKEIAKKMKGKKYARQLDKFVAKHNGASQTHFLTEHY